jgi:enamine deaminase RidA (YjgF/YER057c/UK114 family)
MMETVVINPWTWQDGLGFVQAREVSGAERVVYCAGQSAVDPDGNVLHEGDMRGQLKRSLDNVETVLAEAGLGLADVVRLNYYTTDVDAFFESYDAVTSRLAEAGARVSSTLLGITRLAQPALLVEIEATAAA